MSVLAGYDFEQDIKPPDGKSIEIKNEKIFCFVFDESQQTKEYFSDDDYNIWNGG
jgi:hypothetical protein